MWQPPACKRASRARDSLDLPYARGEAPCRQSRHVRAQACAVAVRCARPPGTGAPPAAADTPPGRDPDPSLVSTKQADQATRCTGQFLRKHNILAQTLYARLDG